jgi:hypothetical protein
VPIDLEFRNSVRCRYDKIDRIWDKHDRWHEYLRGQILACISQLARSHPEPYRMVIDIGAGGYPYDIPHLQYIQLDLATARLPHNGNAVCADAHALPLRDAIADCVVCVGSVVNYCSLIEVIAEASRIATQKADFLIHVELSNSMEFIFTKHFQTDAAFVNTFYRGEEPLWVYSDRAVRQTLTNAGFRIRRSRYLHIASALAYRVLRNSNAAARFASLDPVLRHVPHIGNVAESVLLSCEKIA